MVTGRCSDTERDLVDQLFNKQNYNPLIRPVKDLSETVYVRFEMTLIQLITLVRTQVEVVLFHALGLCLDFSPGS